MHATRQDWDAAQYLRFENERTRPSIDLLARVGATAPERCIDLGCGPGNSTELLAARFPNAAVEGMDSSPDMLGKARARLPELSFALGDVASFAPGPVYDVIFANAVLQWLPDHGTLLPALARALRPGGWLAVQMPDNLDEPSHALMREVARDEAWREPLRAAGAERSEIGSFGDYRRWLQGAGCHVDIWRTTYVHALAGPAAIVEWFKSTGLRPYIDRLDPAAREAFLARYEDMIAKAYPAQQDGTVLLEFPRLFIVARRDG